MTRSQAQNSNLKKRAFSGMLWTLASQGLVFGAQFGTLAVLAQLLSEKELGIATLATAVCNFSMVMGGLGLSRALVQRQNLNQNDYSTAFWGSLGFGTLSCLILLGAAPLLADFYQEPELATLIQVGSVSMILVALPQVHLARLEKDLKFRELGFAHVFGYALPYGAGAILAAFLGAGVWSPIVGSVLGFTCQGALQIHYDRWKPSPVFKSKILRGFLGFGLGITGASLVAFILDNIDYFILGKVRGAVEVGLYTIPFQITAMPRSKISSAVMKVAFPAFSKIQNDHDLLNRSYIKLNSYVAYVTFPMMAGLCAVAGSFVEVVLGEKWLPAVPALQILCGVGALMSIRSTVGTALNALGRADLGFYSNFGVLLVAIPTLLLLAPDGLESTALAMLIVAAVNFFPLQFVLTWLTGLSVPKLLQGLLLPCMMSLVMATGVHFAISPLEGPWGKLILGIVVGVLLYGAQMTLFARPMVQELMRMVLRRRSPKPT